MTESPNPQSQTTEKQRPSRFKFRDLGPIIRAAGLVPSTIFFVILFACCTILITLFEPNVSGIDNAVWFLFQVVTTIGLGDFTAVTVIGRTVVIILSLYSVFYIALITGAVVSYCAERMKARQHASIAEFLVQLEHLPELSHEELVELSDKVKRFHRKL